MPYMVISGNLFEGTAKDINKYLKYLAQGKDTEMLLFGFNHLGRVNDFTGFSKEDAQKEIDARKKFKEELDEIMKVVDPDPISKGDDTDD